LELVANARDPVSDLHHAGDHVPVGVTCPVTLFSDTPIGSGRTLVEGIAGSILLAWILAIVFGLTYNRLLPRH
jgi:hypothetical protein